MIWEMILLVATAYVLYSYILPYMKLRTLEQDALDEYCMIDIRDYQLSHRNPFHVGTKNIPLSYLPRTSKEGEICDRDIVVIAESKIAAAMAARILKKKTKKFIYYVKVS